MDFFSSARRTLALEAQAVASLSEKINTSFQQACELILSCKGRLVVIGMGKSGHIGNKLAATFASTGTPAFAVNAAEASHGDMGMITAEDVVLALSNSGETAEVVSLLPLIKRLQVKLISITAAPASSLARESDVHLDTGVKTEACPLGLAPTSSTTAMLALGDALAVALLEAKGFTAEDFAFSHPGGSLGRKLLLKVATLMHTGTEIPRVEIGTSVKEALLEVTQKRMGMTVVTNSEGDVVGVFTDGDLRRSIEADVNLRNTRIEEVMTTAFTHVSAGMLAAEAVSIMQQKTITSLVVLDENQQLEGLITMHDMLRAGVI